MSRAWIIEFRPPLLEDLRYRLFIDTSEQVAFGSLALDGESAAGRVNEIQFMAPEAFAVQGAFHVELTDQARQEVIKWAWSERMGLAEFHSHRMMGNDEHACFSPTDIDGMREFVPHVRWRLNGAPYTAVVFDERSIDGLMWAQDGSAPEAVGALTSGSGRLETTQLSLAAWHRETS